MVTAALRSRKGQAMVNRLKPHEAFRSIIRRSGVTYDALAKAAGYRHASGVHQYVDPKRGDKPIPYAVIKKMLPELLNKGTPAITADELIAISDAANISYDVRMARAPRPEVEPRGSGVSGSSGDRLPIRYRVEVGVYVEKHRLAGRASGFGPICASPNFEDQWCAVVSDAPPYTRGDVLHCVPLSEVGASRAAGKPCVVRVEKAGVDLVCVEVDTLGTDGRSPVNNPGASVLGVVIATYSLT